MLTLIILGSTAGLVAYALLGLKKKPKTPIASTDPATPALVGLSNPVMGPAYSWDDYLHDVETETPLDEVLEKIAKYGHPTKPNGARDLPDELKARMEARMVWWAQMLQKQPMLKVVPPPAPPKPVLALNVTTMPCGKCAPHHTPGNLMAGMRDGDVDALRRKACRICGGKGFVYLEVNK